LCSLLRHWYVAAAICLAAGVGAAGLLLWQAAVFGGRLHRLTEAAAHETGLAPVDPLDQKPPNATRPQAA
jgi:hypothetical protein